MLTNELMGSALLGIAWVTALMVMLDAFIDVRAMWKRLSAWNTSLLQGVVKAPELATHEVEQRIKQLDSQTPGLLFFDRKHVSHVTGGAVEVGGQTLEVIGLEGAEFWPAHDAQQAAAACDSTATFDALQKAAQGPGGGLRTVRTVLRAGQPVWLEGKQNGASFEASLVSGADPRVWARSRLLMSLGVMLLSIAWVAAGTVLALWPPVFGLVSIVGAVVLLAHFLLMTPLAMGVREKVRSPAIAYVRGSWKRDAVETAVASATPVNGQ
ncbi:MAG: hypothetical protein DI536_19915 [Archangium gephyra]|uniref:Uncharacterized protein n=1 Tax=Archangium gephyra TaxID=48 RepID=A0A2W5T502_9BACT|nr:MAG: hypothetical protein DI536_19915 [Archangium gephyra]